MLKKLLKHEWKATSGGLLTVHLALLLLSLIGAGTLAALRDGSVPETVWIFYLTVFSLMIFASFIVTHILLIMRFYRNLFTAEGYLTHTIPVGAGRQLLCKLLNYLMWSVLDILCIIAAFLLLEPESSGKLILNLLGAFPRAAASYGAGASVGFVLTVIAAVLAGLSLFILLFYFCISLGSLFSSHRILAAVLFFLAFFFLQQFITLPGVTMFSYWLLPDASGLSGTMQAVPSRFLNRFCQLMWIYILVELLLCTVYFAVSRYILRRKLNLP